MNLPFHNKPLAPKPKALCCYICGREYGTSSLQIHIAQCQKLWIQREELKPKNERRPLPQAPRNFSSVASGGARGSDIDAYNDTAFRQYNDVALVPCAFCGRTFLPEKLVVHNRSCTKDNPAARVNRLPISDVNTSTPNKATGASSARTPIRPVIAGSASPAKPTINSPGMLKTAPAALSGIGGLRASPSSITSPSPSASSPSATSLSPSVEEKNINSDTRSVSFAAEGEEEGELISSSVPKASYVLPEDVEDHEPEGEQAQCQKCGRSFIVERLAKHERVCKGPQELKKRLNYDPAKAAAATGTSSSTITTNNHGSGVNPTTRRSAAGGKGDATTGDDVPAWKSKHEEFQASIRYARKMDEVIKRGGNVVKELPPPPPAANPDYVQCPHCGRRYNQEAGSRHIPQCANIINKPKPPPHLRPGQSGGGGVGGSGGSGGGSGSGSGGLAALSMRANSSTSSVSAGSSLLRLATASSTSRSANPVSSSLSSSSGGRPSNGSGSGSVGGLARVSTHRTTTPSRSRASPSPARSTSSTTNQSNSGNKFCVSCGTPRVPGGRFCAECGRPH